MPERRASYSKKEINIRGETVIVLVSALGLVSAVGCAVENKSESAPTPISTELPTLTPVYLTPFPTLTKPLPSPAPTNSPSPTETPTTTPWPTVTPHPWKGSFPFLSREKMPRPETVPYVEPGDLIGQSIPELGTRDTIIIYKKDGRMITIDDYVFDEYLRRGVMRLPNFSVDHSLGFDISRDGKAVIGGPLTRDKSSWATLARYDLPRGVFVGPPTVDIQTKYVVAIKDGRWLHIAEVGNYHNGPLWLAPKEWKLNRVIFGAASQADDLFLEREDSNNQRSVWLLKDAVPHGDYPRTVIDRCGESTHKRTGTHCEMEFLQYDFAKQSWPLRSPEKRPKLEFITDKVINISPITLPLTPDGNGYVIYPAQELK